MKANKTVLLAIAACAFGACAELPEQTGEELAARIRKGHPRMFFTAETWPEIKARTEGCEEGRAALSNLIARADSYPTNPVCAHFGKVNTPKSQPIVNVREWGRAASECALAWRFTGERKYLEKVERMLRVSAEAYHAAIANGRAVHWYSTSRILAMCAYDWAYEGMSGESRKAIAESIARHVEEVQPRKGRPYIIRRNTGGVTSGFYSVLSLPWYSGVAFANDGACDALAAKQLGEGYELVRRLMAYRAEYSGDDGALAHGTPDYTMGAYPWAHFNIMHVYLSAFGKNLASEYSSLALFPNWIWWNRIANADKPSRPYEFGYGDGQHQENYLAVGPLFEHMSQYSYFWREADPDAARLAATLAASAPDRVLTRTWPMYPFLFCGGKSAEPFTPAEISSRRILARHFPDVGQIFMRSGSGPDDTYCLYVAGSRTMMHKHMDEGHFIIYRGGHLALDSGTRAAETDTSLRYYYSQTVAHNSVLIHKPGEPMPEHWGLASEEGAARTNDGGQYPGSAKLLAFASAKDFAYAASDQTALYRDKCREATRQFVFLPPDVFVVYDRVESSSATYEKEWLLHTQNEPQFSGSRMTCANRGGRLECETLLPSASRPSKIGGPDREFWSNGKNWRLDPKFLRSAAASAKREGIPPQWGNWRYSVSPAASASADRFLHVITVGGASSFKPAASRLVQTSDCDAAEIVLPDGRKASVSFNRTGAVGGSISIGATSRPLPTTVQPQSGVCGL